MFNDDIMYGQWPISIPDKPPVMTQTRTGVYCLSLSIVSTNADPGIAPESVDVRCYCNHAYDGEKWNSFQYTVAAYGEELPLITHDEYQQRLDAISNNERGTALQAALEQFQEGHLTPLSPYHPAHQFLHVARHLENRFKAMLALELFRMTVSSGWGDIPF